MTNQYNNEIRILAGFDEEGEPTISFSMNDDTAEFLENIATYNNISIGELVGYFLINMDQTFENSGRDEKHLQ